MERITLRAADLEVQLQPALGGCIARFDWLGAHGQRLALMRGTDDANGTDVLQAACFPLVPFANRIRGGQFDCNGRSIRLAPNMAGDASPQHGQGWLASWDVASVSPTEAELVFRHAAGEWPWDYEARQHFRLAQDRLTMRLSCRNLSSEPMPCGLALHPYFPCNADTVLDTSVTGAWTIDAATLPVARVPATGRYALSHRHICGQGLDNGFDGWGGSARISWPDREALALALEMRSADAGRFQVYSPTAGGVFVAEPVQNANAALNEPFDRWRDLGIEMLGCEEGRELTVEFVVTGMGVVRGE
ncbi:MAG: aldose 1-epimerase [Rhodoferax sp.]|nr:aldose 1-epimerase [Rhodoferax sp.]